MRAGWTSLVLAAAFAAAGPARAAADGLPTLDPTNGLFGTAYDFVMPGAGASMDPAAGNAVVSWGGNVWIYQAGSPVLEAYILLDTNRDGSTDRTMTCDGVVGSGRFALHCYDDDGLGNFELLLRGKVVVQPNGTITLRRATGRGYDDAQVYTFGFQASQQVP